VNDQVDEMRREFSFFGEGAGNAQFFFQMHPLWG
jgi:hypothetical protein